MSQGSGNGNHSALSQDEQSNGRREQNYLAMSSSAPMSDGRRYSDSQEYFEENNYLESASQSNGPEDQYMTWSPSRNCAHQVMDSPLLSPSRRCIDSPERPDRQMLGQTHSPGGKSTVEGGTPPRKENAGYWDNMSPHKALLYSPRALSGQFLPEDDRGNEEAMDLYSPGQHILHILNKDYTNNGEHTSRHSRAHATTQSSSTSRARTSGKRSSQKVDSSSQPRSNNNGNQANISEGMLPAPHSGSSAARKNSVPRGASSNTNDKNLYDDEEAAKMLISLSPQREIPNHESLLDSARSDYSAKGRPDSPLLGNTLRPLDFGDDDDDDNDNKAAAEDGSSSSMPLRINKNNASLSTAAQKKGKSSNELNDTEPETPRDLSPLHTEAFQSNKTTSASGSHTATKKNSVDSSASGNGTSKQQQNVAPMSTVMSKRAKGVVSGTGSITIKATTNLARSHFTNTDSSGSKGAKKKVRSTKNENSVAHTPTEEIAASSSSTALKTPPRQVRKLQSNNKNNSKSNSDSTTSEDSSVTRKVSPYLGVSWIRASQRWRADSVIKGKLKYLGCFRTEEEAACAVDDARAGSWDGNRKLRLNFPERQPGIPNNQKTAAVKNVDGEGNKKSDFIGVVWDSKQGQWRARICVPDEKWIIASYHNRTSGSPTSGHVELRHFSTELEAAKAVDQAKFDTYSRILNMAESDSDRLRVPKPRLNFPDEFGLRQPGRNARSKAQRRIAKYSSSSPGRNSDSMSTASYESSPSIGMRSPDRQEDTSPVIHKTSNKRQSTSEPKTLQRRDSSDGADANSSIISPAANPSPAKRRRKKKITSDTASASSS